MPSELFRAPDPWSIVEASPFATLVALPSGEVAHAPLLVEPDRTLIGHVAGGKEAREGGLTALVDRNMTSFRVKLD